MIAGPSEILVIADENSDPVQLSADLLSQAEHDQNASTHSSRCSGASVLAMSMAWRRFSVTMIFPLPSMEARAMSCRGVGEIIMVSPPSRSGDIAPVILAAAKIAGVGRVFRVGGAQAVAALAFQLLQRALQLFGRDLQTLGSGAIELPGIAEQGAVSLPADGARPLPLYRPDERHPRQNRRGR